MTPICEALRVPLITSGSDPEPTGANRGVRPTALGSPDAKAHAPLSALRVEGDSR